MLDITKSSDWKKVGDTVTTSYYDIDALFKNIDLYNADSIDQSIENLILTMNGERLFNIQFGSPFYRILFENVNQADNLMPAVYDKIENYIPIKINRGSAKVKTSAVNHSVSVSFVYSTNDGVIKNHSFMITETF